MTTMNMSYAMLKYVVYFSLTLAYALAVSTARRDVAFFRHRFLLKSKSTPISRPAILGKYASFAQCRETQLRLIHYNIAALERARVNNPGVFLKYIETNFGRGILVTEFSSLHAEEIDVLTTYIAEVQRKLRVFRDTLETLRKSSETDRTCPICLGGNDDGLPRVYLPCGHGYHDQCIRTWLSRKKTCPMCNARINHASQITLRNPKIRQDICRGCVGNVVRFEDNYLESDIGILQLDIRLTVAMEELSVQRRFANSISAIRRYNMPLWELRLALQNFLIDENIVYEQASAYGFCC